MRTYSRGVAFSPSSLFADGEPGVHFETVTPAQNASQKTMWQESSGQTLVTAVEQPVGLWLDTKEGLRIEAAPTIDGSLNTATWTKGTGWLAPTGTSASCDGTQAADSSLSIANGAADYPVASGYRYRWEVVISSATGNITITAGSGETRVVAAPGTYYLFGTGAGNVGSLTAAAGATCIVDSVSIDRVYGNHAIQATSASRPVLSARYNLLTKTEQFDDAAWTKVSSGIVVTANATTDPLGGSTADKLVGSSASTSKEMFNASAAAIVSGQSYVASVYAKAAEYSWIYVCNNNDSTINGHYVNLSNGSLGTAVGASPGTVAVEDAGNGWWRIEVTKAASNTSGFIEIFLATADGAGVPAFTGDDTSGVYAWGAQYLSANAAALSNPAYQRVNTSTDYDSEGFIHYLKFDGFDDSLQTPSIDFSSGDKMTVWTGVTKLSDAAAGMICELTANGSSTAGGFYLSGPDSAASNYGVSVFGTAQAKGVWTTYAAPSSDVAVVGFDITGASIAASIPTNRIDGAAPTTNTQSGVGAGGTVFANAAFNIGRRNNTDTPLNGRLTSLTARGSTTVLADTPRNQMEQYTADKAGQTFTST